MVIVIKLNGDSEPRILSLFRKASLTIRTNLLVCIQCDSTMNVEMHHIRALKHLGSDQNIIARAMAARKRKQIPLCRHCHNLKHKQLNAIRKNAERAKLLEKLARPSVK